MSSTGVYVHRSIPVVLGQLNSTGVQSVAEYVLQGFRSSTGLIQGYMYTTMVLRSAEVQVYR